MLLPPRVLWALVYAATTSLHIPEIKLIKTGLLSDRQYVFFNSLFSVPLLAALTIPELLHSGIPHIHWTFWLLAIAAAVIQCNGLRRSSHAFSNEDISLITPLKALVPVLLSVFAWLAWRLFPRYFPNQHLTMLDIVGIAIIVIGIYSGVAGGGEVTGFRGWFVPFKAFNNVRTVRVYLLASGIYVLFPLTLVPALYSVSPSSPYFVATVVLGVMCIYAAPWKRKERQLDSIVIQDMLAGIRRGPVWRELLPWSRHLLQVIRRKEEPNHKKTQGGWLVAAFALSAAIVAIQQYAELTAYRGGATSVTSAIFKLDIPLAVLWGIVFLHERSPLQRLISGLVIGIGVILLT